MKWINQMSEFLLTMLLCYLVVIFEMAQIVGGKVPPQYHLPIRSWQHPLQGLTYLLYHQKKIFHCEINLFQLYVRSLSFHSSALKDTELTLRADASNKWPLELSICRTFRVTSMLFKIHEKQSRRKIELKRGQKGNKSKVRRGIGNERLPFVFNYSYGSLATVEYQLYRTVGGLISVKVSFFVWFVFLECSREWKHWCSASIVTGMMLGVKISKSCSEDKKEYQLQYYNIALPHLPSPTAALNEIQDPSYSPLWYLPY